MPAVTSKRYPIEHHGTLGAGGDRGNLYTSLPYALARDGELSAMARSVALYVWSHSEGYQTSAEEVATALGATRKTVGAALANLQACGWLVRQQYARPGKRAAWERWHVQLSNTRFTPEEIERLSRTVTIQDEAPCVEITQGLEDHGSNLPTVVGNNYPGGWVKTTHQSSEPLVVNSPEVNSTTREGSNNPTEVLETSEGVEDIPAEDTAGDTEGVPEVIEPWNPIPPPNLSVGSYVEDIRRKPEPEWNPLAAHTTVSAVVVETDSNDLFAGFTAPDFSAND